MEAAISERPVNAFEASTVESRLVFNGGLVEVRRYEWKQPIQDFWTGEHYLLDLPLSRRPAVSRAAYVDTGTNVGRDLGHIMFVPPGRHICSGSGEGQYRALICLLDRDMIEGLLDSPANWNRIRLAQGLSLNCPEIEWILMKIYRELREGGFAAQLMVERLAGALAIAVARRFELDLGEPRHTGGLAPHRLKLIHERLAAELPPPNLAELAELCGMSVRHLSRTLKAETGMTAAKYMEQAVMERARRLLTERRLSVAEVAMNTGFSSTSTFSLAFKRVMGVRPREAMREFV